MIKILCTNDDGYKSVGLEASVDCAKRLTSEVVVYAPEQNQTATGGKTRFYHSINFRKVDVAGVPGYAIDGTPMEIMRFALTGKHEKPDLVVSGINFGEQIGAVPVFMSGTCAGAFFAASLGFPALAIGYQMNKGMFHDHQTPLEVDLHDYPGLVLEKIIGKALEHGIEPFTFWNINFPANPTSEIVVAELEHWGYWDERIDIFDDSRFEINGDQKPDGHEKGTDAYYFSKGKIVLTPIRVNMTDPMGFEKVKKIDFS